MDKIELTGDETNEVLKSICDEFSITVEAKTPKKPNKTELITAIDKYNGVETVDEANDVGSENIEDDLSEEEYAELMGETDDGKKEKTKKKKALTKREMKQLLFKLHRVQVTCNDETQTKRDVKFITWGNDIIAHQTDRLLMNRPWHIREGALRNLESNTFMKQVPNPETGNPEFIEMPMYNIIKLPMLSIEEYREMGKQQAVKTAAAEALTQ